MQGQDNDDAGGEPGSPSTATPVAEEGRGDGGADADPDPALLRFDPARVRQAECRRLCEGNPPSLLSEKAWALHRIVASGDLQALEANALKGDGRIPLSVHFNLLKLLHEPLWGGQWRHQCFVFDGYPSQPMRAVVASADVSSRRVVLYDVREDWSALGFPPAEPRAVAFVLSADAVVPIRRFRPGDQVLFDLPQDVRVEDAAPAAAAATTANADTVSATAAKVATTTSAQDDAQAAPSRGSGKGASCSPGPELAGGFVVEEVPAPFEMIPDRCGTGVVA